MKKRNAHVTGPLPRHTVLARLKRRGALLSYPDLKNIPEHEWPIALSRARALPLDMVEMIGIVAGVVLVTWMLRDLMPATDVAAATTLNVMRFFMALPLLALFAGPFMLRRTRRGLATLRQQQESASSAKTYLKEVSHE